VQRFIGTALAAFCSVLSGALIQAQEPAADAVLDRAIKALGGEKMLSKSKAFVWKGYRKRQMHTQKRQVTIQGLDRARYETVLDQFNCTTCTTVVNGDEVWRRFAGTTEKLQGFGALEIKQYICLEAIPITLLPIKTNGLKYRAAADVNIGGKAASVLKITGPDGKELTLCFEKESGLPVKEIATVSTLFDGDCTMEAAFSNYKEFGGIKKATRIEVTLAGELAYVVEVTEFKVLSKVAPETFSLPK
jgi:hypothetical protein